MGTLDPDICYRSPNMSFGKPGAVCEKGMVENIFYFIIQVENLPRYKSQIFFVIRNVENWEFEAFFSEKLPENG